MNILDSIPPWIISGAIILFVGYVVFKGVFGQGGHE